MEMVYKTTIIIIIIKMKYVEYKTGIYVEYKLMQTVRTHQQHKHNTVPHSHQSPEISSERHEANKNHNSQAPEERWVAKRLHGQFLWSLDAGLIDKEQS
jgi:hypothetical protein